MRKLIDSNTILHPCFNSQKRDYVRMHIPLTMSCNIKCLYCNRKVGCINENRPGISMSIMNEDEIYEYCLRVKKKYSDRLKIVGFAGPGEVLTDIEKLCRAIAIIRSELNVEFCLATNGLLLPIYAERLLEEGVKYFTITMNANTASTAAKIYSEIEYCDEKFTGKQAGEILLNNQKEGMKIVCKRGGICKVNVVAIKGVNLDEIDSIMLYARQCGAYIGNIIPLMLLEGTIYTSKNQVSDSEIMKLRCHAEQYIKQMKHCQMCRADAVGNLM